MFHASNLEVRESGYTAFGLSDHVCVHSLCKRSVSITVYLMKFNIRSFMKYNMKKHHESEGEG